LAGKHKTRRRPVGLTTAYALGPAVGQCFQQAEMATLSLDLQKRSPSSSCIPARSGGIEKAGYDAVVLKANPKLVYIWIMTIQSTLDAAHRRQSPSRPRGHKKNSGIICAGRLIQLAEKRSRIACITNEKQTLETV
jgi:hypothetical protein